MAHTKGPWHLNEHGKIVSSDGRTVPVGGFSLAMYSSPEVIANDNLLSAGPELLEALENVEREHELLRWMKNCEHRRRTGNYGIAVDKDEIALEWQSHNRNLEKIISARNAILAKAKGLNPDQG